MRRTMNRPNPFFPQMCVKPSSLFFHPLPPHPSHLHYFLQACESSAARHPTCDEVLTQLSRASMRCTLAGRPSIAPESCCGRVAADVVLDPQRATADGRDGLQPVVPLVCGAERDDEVWDATVFTKNRDRLLEADVAKEFLSRVVEQAQTKVYLGRAFYGDARCWKPGGAKSFQPKEGKSSPPSDDDPQSHVNFRASGGRMKRMNRRPIPRRCWRAKAKARSRN